MSAGGGGIGTACGPGAEQARPLLVVGPTGLLIEALVRLARQQGFEATMADPVGIELAMARHRPGAVLIDARLGAEELRRCATLARWRRPGIRVLVLAGDDAQAPEVGADAELSVWSTTEELCAVITSGAAAHARSRVRARAGAGGRAEDGREWGLIAHLTPREIQILRTLMAGASNQQTADRLGISPNTVRTHVQNMLGKLAVRTRLEAVTLGLRHGLRPLADPDQPEREVS